MTTLGDIYRMIQEKNEETGNQNAWVDTESNTIWVLGGEDELYRFQAEGSNLKDMTEQELSELVTFILTMDEEEF